MFRHHSHIATSAYLDLLRILQDRQVLDIRGSIVRLTRGSRTYLYDDYRVGSENVRRYIGEATPDLEARLDHAQSIKAEEKEREKTRTRLVRVLRAEGMARLDAATGSLLYAFEKAGLFRLGGTLVGTVAFQLYEGELGARPAGTQIVQTDDLDIASFERLSVALGDSVTETLPEILADFDFAPVPTLDAGKVWRWRQTGRESMVEFLTPAFGDEGLRDLPALGVSAQALNYLNYLIAEPIAAVALYRSGVLVQIPRPERFAIHKLIVADRRRDGREGLKARKDRAQAAFLIEVLAEDRPDELAEAWADARASGARWRERIDRTLARMPQTASRLAALAG